MIPRAPRPSPRPGALARLGRAASPLAIAAALAATAPPPAEAGPKGGAVKRGQAEITTRGARTVIRQGGQKVVIDWDSFDIDADEVVRFIQPGKRSVALNRVLDTMPTHIRGRLEANGSVWLVNRHGVIFHSGSAVNVGGLLASTADITDDDFMAGRYAFGIPGAPGARIVNKGDIRFEDAGLVGLIGAHAENRGTIRGRVGTVVVAGAETFAVDLAGDGLFAFELDEATTGVSAAQAGEIVNAGGEVLISAAAADALVDAAVSVAGVIDVDGPAGGSVAVSAPGGTATVSGAVRARGTAGDGGAVDVRAAEIQVTRRAEIDASGALAGGRAEIVAEAGLVFAGTALARGEAGPGGFIDTSGAEIDISGFVSTGPGGTWLIDPTDIDIGGGDDDVDLVTLRAAIADGTGAVVETPNAGGEDGDITVFGGLTDIDVDAGVSGSLTLNADANVILQAGSGGITQLAGDDGTFSLTLNTANGLAGITQNAQPITLGPGSTLTLLGGAARRAPDFTAANLTLVTPRNLEIEAGANRDDAIDTGLFLPLLAAGGTVSIDAQGGGGDPGNIRVLSGLEAVSVTAGEAASLQLAAANNVVLVPGAAAADPDGAIVQAGGAQGALDLSVVASSDIILNGDTRIDLGDDAELTLEAGSLALNGTSSLTLGDGGRLTLIDGLGEGPLPAFDAPRLRLLTRGDVTVGNAAIRTYEPADFLPAVQAGTEVTLRAASGGDLTVFGGLDAIGVDEDAAGGLGLDAAGTLSFEPASGGVRIDPAALGTLAVTLAGDGGIELPNVDATTLSVSASGGVTQRAGTALDVEALTDVLAGARGGPGGDVLLDGSGNNLRTLSVDAGTDAVSVDDDQGSLLLGEVRAGSLSVAVEGGLDQVGGTSVQVGGATTVVSVTGADALDVTLDNVANRFGAIAVTAAGNDVAVTDSQGALALGAIQAGTLTVAAVGAVTQTAAATVGGAATVTTVGPAAAPTVALSQAGNAFGSIGVEATGDAGARGDVLIVEGSAVQLGRVTADALTLQSGGAISQGAGGANRVAATGAVTLSGYAGDSVILDNPNNDFGFVTANDAATTLSLADADAIGFGAVTADLLIVDAGGQVSSDATLTATEGRFRAGRGGAAGGILLGAAANDFGTLSLDAPGDTVAVEDASGVILDAVNVGALTLRTGGDVTQTGDSGIAVAGLADFVSDNPAAGVVSVTLADPENDFGTVRVRNVAAGLDALAVALADANAVTLSTLDAGTLTVTAGSAGGPAGSVLQAGGTRIEAGTAEISTLGDGVVGLEGENLFGTLALDVNGGTAVVQDVDALALGDVEAGALAILAGGAVTQEAGATITGNTAAEITAFGAGGAAAVTLDAAGNDFSELSVIGSTVVVRDADDLTLRRSRATQTLDVAADQAGGAPDGLTLREVSVGPGATPEAPQTLVAVGAFVDARDVAAGGLTLTATNGDVSLLDFFADSLTLSITDTTIDAPGAPGEVTVGAGEVVEGAPQRGLRIGRGRIVSPFVLPAVDDLSFLGVDLGAEPSAFNATDSVELDRVRTGAGGLAVSGRTVRLGRVATTGLLTATATAGDVTAFGVLPGGVGGASVARVAVAAPATLAAPTAPPGAGRADDAAIPVDAGGVFDRLVEATTASVTASGAVLLGAPVDGLENDVDGLTATALTGGVAFRDADALLVGDIDAAVAISLTAAAETAGALTQAAGTRLIAPTLSVATLTDGSDATLANANEFGALAAGVLGTLAVTDAGTLGGPFEGTSITALGAEALTLTSADAVTQTGVISVTGASVMDAPSITLGLDNAFGPLTARAGSGAVTVRNANGGDFVRIEGGAVTLTVGAGDVALGDVDAGTLTVGAEAGSIRQSADGVTVTGAADFAIAPAAGAEIALDGSTANDFQGRVSASAGPDDRIAILDSAGDLAVGTLSGGLLDVRADAGDLTQTAGTVLDAADAAATLRAAGDMLLDDVSAGSLDAEAGGGFAQRASSEIDVAGLVGIAAADGILFDDLDAGALAATDAAGGGDDGVAQRAGSRLVVPGAATLTATDAAADIVLTEAGNDFGSVEADAGTTSDVSITDTNALTLGPIAARDLTAAAGAGGTGALSQATGTTIALAGRAALSGVDGVALGEISADALEATSGSGGFAQAAGTAMTVLGAAEIAVDAGAAFADASAASLEVTAANGGVTQADGTALSVAGETAIVATGAGGGVTLASPGNDFDVFAVDAGANGLVVHDAGDLVFGDVVAASMGATAAGDLSQVDGTAIDVAGDTGVDVGGNVDFTSPGNDFGGFGGAVVGTLDLVDGAGDLSLADLAAGAADIRVPDGGLTQTGTVAFAGPSRIDVADSIALDLLAAGVPANSFGDALTLDAAGAIALEAADIGAGLSMRSETAAVRVAAGDLLLGLVEAESLTATVDAGALGQTADGVRVPGTASVSAPEGIALDAVGVNDFGTLNARAGDLPGVPSGPGPDLRAEVRIRDDNVAGPARDATPGLELGEVIGSEITLAVPDDGDAEVDPGGVITQTPGGRVFADVSTTVTEAERVFLPNAGNRFGRFSANIADRVEVEDEGDLVLGRIRASELQAIAGGGISQIDTILVQRTTTLVAAGGDIVLVGRPEGLPPSGEGPPNPADPFNDFGADGAETSVLQATASGAVTITDAGDLRVDDVAAGGAVTLTAIAGALNASDVTAGGPATATAGTDATLTGLRAPAGRVTVTAGQDATLAGGVSRGVMRVTAGRDAVVTAEPERDDAGDPAPPARIMVTDGASGLVVTAGRDATLTDAGASAGDVRATALLGTARLEGVAAVGAQSDLTVVGAAGAIVGASAQRASAAGRDAALTASPGADAGAADLEAGRDLSLSAGGAAMAERSSAGRDLSLSAGGAAMAEQSSAGRDLTLSAGGTAMAERSSAGRDAALDAGTDAEADRLDAGRIARLDAGGAAAASRVVAERRLTLDADGAATATDSVARTGDVSITAGVDAAMLGGAARAGDVTVTAGGVATLRAVRAAEGRLRARGEAGVVIEQGGGPDARIVRAAEVEALSRSGSVAVDGLIVAGQASLEGATAVEVADLEVRGADDPGVGSPFVGRTPAPGSFALDIRSGGGVGIEDATLRNPAGTLVVRGLRGSPRAGAEVRMRGRNDLAGAAFIGATGREGVDAPPAVDIEGLTLGLIEVERTTVGENFVDNAPALLDSLEDDFVIRRIRAGGEGLLNLFVEGAGDVRVSSDGALGLRVEPGSTLGAVTLEMAGGEGKGGRVLEVFDGFGDIARPAGAVTVIGASDVTFGRRASDGASLLDLDLERDGPAGLSDHVFATGMLLQAVDGLVLLSRGEAVNEEFLNLTVYSGVSLGSLDFSGSAEIAGDPDGIQGLDMTGAIGGVRIRAAGLSPIKGVVGSGSLEPTAEDFRFNLCVIGDPNDCSSDPAPPVRIDPPPTEAPNLFVIDLTELADVYGPFGNEELWAAPAAFTRDLEEEDEE